MQILESTDKITPRSILRHRPIGESIPTKKRASPVSEAEVELPVRVTPVAQRASRTRQAEITTRIPASVTRDEQTKNESDAPVERNTIVPTREASQRSAPSYRTGVHPASSMPRAKKVHVKPARVQQVHPLLYLGVGMLAMIVLWMIVSGVVRWTTVTLDDLRYGRPRTAQYDVVVGHNDSTVNPSHFIVINLHKHVEIIEFPGGDASHARIYMGPQLYGADDDLTPATLSFVDVNGDHKLDMVMTVQGSHFVLLNDQGTFRVPTVAEHRQIDLFLLHWKP